MGEYVKIEIILFEKGEQGTMKQDIQLPFPPPLSSPPTIIESGKGG